MARAPLGESTVARNVIAHDVGAINIDGCRADSEKVEGGRWPANATMTHAEACTDGSCAKDCPVSLLDEDSPGASERLPRFKYAPKATGADACRDYNNHPTVKHTSLMEWMVELITRPGHVVLDPFMGSGTTGVACARLGRRFVGVELDPNNYKIAHQRLVDQGEAESAPRPKPRQGGKPITTKRKRKVLGRKRSKGVL